MKIILKSFIYVISLLSTLFLYPFSPLYLNVHQQEPAFSYQKKASPHLYSKMYSHANENPYLTPYERMIKGQIKAILKKHVIKQGEPILGAGEEIASWVLATGLLYTLTTDTLKWSKFRVAPYLAFDALLAYSHYPLYKSLGHYPSINYVGFPSISMLAAILIAQIWKKIRGAVERSLFNRYKNLAEFTIINHEEIELDHETIQALENQCLHIKEELVERGLYNSLHLVCPELTKAFEKLEYASTDANDYQKAYDLIGLIQKIMNVLKPL